MRPDYALQDACTEGNRTALRSIAWKALLANFMVAVT